MVMLAPNLNLSMFLSQYAETMIPMYEIVQIPLDSYEDLLFVQEHLAIYYSMPVLERSLLLSYGQYDIERCQQFTSSGVGTPIIYNRKQAEDTTAQGIVYDFDGSEA